MMSASHTRCTQEIPQALPDNNRQIRPEEQKLKINTNDDDNDDVANNNSDDATFVGREILTSAIQVDDGILHIYTFL